MVAFTKPGPPSRSGCSSASSDTMPLLDWRTSRCTSMSPLGVRWTRASSRRQRALGVSAVSIGTKIQVWWASRVIRRLARRSWTKSPLVTEILPSAFWPASVARTAIRASPTRISPASSAAMSMEAWPVMRDGTPWRRALTSRRWVRTVARPSRRARRSTLTVRSSIGPCAVTVAPRLPLRSVSPSATASSSPTRTVNSAASMTGVRVDVRPLRSPRISAPRPSSRSVAPSAAPSAAASRSSVNGRARGVPGTVSVPRAPRSSWPSSGSRRASRPSSTKEMFPAGAAPKMAAGSRPVPAPLTAAEDRSAAAVALITSGAPASSPRTPACQGSSSLPRRA